jgi:hypothetical protein
MVKFPVTRRVLFHHLVNVFLIEFKLSAGLAKHLAAYIRKTAPEGTAFDNQIR